MKEKTEKKIETLMYGAMSFLFGMAFFFGVLYPEHGLSAGACLEKKVPVETKQPAARTYGRLRNNLWEEINDCEKSQIRYRFYIYERLKNS